MDSHGSNAPYSGPETLEALTADRMSMWHSFTNATTGAIIFMIVLLIGMAFFLL
jgi:hypothetical protein